MGKKKIGDMMERYLESEKASTTIIRKVDENMLHTSTSEGSIADIIADKVDDQMQENNIFL